MTVECHLVRDLRSRTVEAKVILPTVPNVGDTLWVESSGKSSRMLIAKVGYDAIDVAHRAPDNRPVATVLLQIQDPKPGA